MLEQGSFALAIAFGGLIVLLFAGTQLLDWYWPAILLLVALAAGMWRIRGRVPSGYAVAQQIDSCLGLQDAISTALYFERERQRPAHRDLVQAQKQMAESAAARADAVAASPLRMPRQAWASLMLLVLSGGLLAVRYGFQGSLDLRQPLVHMPFDTFSDTPAGMGKAKSFPKQKLPDGLEALNVPAEGLDQRDGDPRKTAEEQTFEAPAVPSDEPSGKQSPAGKNGDPTDQPGKEPGEATEKGEGASAGDDSSQKDGGSNNKGPQNAKAPAQGKNPNASPPSGENSSLMDKMKDAMANMLSRMKMNPRQGDMSKSNAAAPQGAAQSASAQKQTGQKGAPAPGKPQGEGQAKSDEAGEQQGEGASKNMTAQGKMSDSAGDKQQAQEGKSGAGKQDGEKEIKAAEQAAAMGKISELLGKRAQNLTGEVMVEVSSGRQQLKTQYVQKAASHTDAGGDISRDEVPAAYQQFVQQYFDELRKPAAKSKPATP